MWQSEQARCGVVLREVFAWLGGAELARAGAACRAWRRAAADPPLWRALVLRAALPHARDALRATTANYEWREEFVCAHAPWKPTGSVRAGGAALLHGALAPGAPWLALAADDASVAVWSRGAAGGWRERCRLELRQARGWASAARVMWAPRGRRLLVAGPRALADVAAAWELLVLQFDGTTRGIGLRECRAQSAHHVVCVQRSGAAGCWAGGAGDAFLSLETSALAPAVACTAVWLNAATQETQSEFAGVTARLLRVYNEGGANILHALVAEVPWSALDTPPAAHPAAHPAAAYYRATRLARDTDTPHDVGEWSQLRALVLCWDGGRAARGGGVSLWALGAPQPPPLEAHAAGSLRARYLAHRERRRAPPPEAPPPDEAAVRALCTAPEAACALPAPPLGAAPHPGGRCLWLSLADGLVVCVSLPALMPLHSLSSAAHAPAPLPAPPALPAPAIYYAQPSVSHHHVAAPTGALCGPACACVWAALGGARAALRALPPAPPVAALLPPGWPLTLLVLAGDSVHIWQSRATPQSLPGWP